MQKLWILLLIPLLFLSCTSEESVPEESFKIEEALQIIVDEFDAESWSYKSVALELNKPVKVNAGGNRKHNVNIQLCMEGGEFTVIADNEDVQLSVDSNRGPWVGSPSCDGRYFGYEVELAHQGNFSACMPTMYTSAWVGDVDFAEKVNIDKDGYYVGTEYYLTIKAYKNLKHMVTARLKFTQIQDYAGNGYEERADFTVELMEYQYSYMYDLMQP